MNGVGTDAVMLVYDAEAKKVSLDQRGPPAPKLATIEWYQKNNGGKLPTSDGLLAAAACPAWSTRGTCCSIAGAR